MNKLNKLAIILYRNSFKSEAAEVLKLKPVEHPDWKDEWEEPSDYSPAEVAPSGIIFSEVDSVESRMNDILKNLGITIITDESNDPIGRGGHGDVYRCIYNGKPAVTKIQFYRKEDYRPYGQDVDNWNKLMSLWETVPDFVKKHIPQVFFATKGNFKVNPRGYYLYLKNMWGNPPYDPNDNSEHEFEYQIMVMEELRPLPGRLGYSVEGGSSDTPWLWEEELDNFYQKIWAEFLKFRATPPDRGDFSRIISSTPNDSRNYVPMVQKIKNVVIDKIKSQFSTFDPEGQQLLNSIELMLKDLSYSFQKSIPRWGDDPPPSNYIPRDVQGLWKAIDWLRNNGMKADDITSDNVMIDSSGTLKIADLGSL